MMSDGGETHGGDAAALRTVGVATELAGRNRGLEVGRDGMSGAGEDAVFRRFGRVAELLDAGLVHVQNGIKRPQA